MPGRAIGVESAVYGCLGDNAPTIYEVIGCTFEVFAYGGHPDGLDGPDGDLGTADGLGGEVYGCLQEMSFADRDPTVYVVIGCAAEAMGFDLQRRLLTGSGRLSPFPRRGRRL